MFDRLTPMGGTSPLPHPTAHERTLNGRPGGGAGRYRMPGGHR